MALLTLGSAAIGGLASGIGSLFGGGSKKPAETKKSEEGIGGSLPDESAPQVNVAGSLAKNAVRDLAEGAINQGIESVLGKSPAEMGKDQREYMANAHPSLNEWEQAGASAAGAASDQEKAAQTNRAQMQANRTQERIAKHTNETQLKATEMQNKTQRDISGAQLGQSAPLVLAQTEASKKQIEQMDAGIKSMAIQNDLTKAQTSKVYKEIKTILDSQSSLGKIYSDINQLGQKWGLDIDTFMKDTVVPLILDIGKKTGSALSPEGERKIITNQRGSSGAANDPTR